jgi:hypothetical protein
MGLVEGGLDPVLMEALEGLEGRWAVVVGSLLRHLGELDAKSQSREEEAAGPGPSSGVDHRRIRAAARSKHLGWLQSRGMDYSVGRQRIVFRDPNKGGAPPTLYRQIVAAVWDRVLEELPASPGTAQVRRRVSELLKPHFSRKLADPSSVGILSETLRNIKREREKAASATD